MATSTRGHSKNRPVAGVDEYRRPLFAVARVAVPEGATPAEGGTEAWGRVRVVRGGVTQHHRDLLDAIRVTAQHRMTDSAEREHLIFDDAEVRRALGKKTAWQDTREALLDMTTTVVQIGGEGQSWGAAFPLATFVGDANSPAARAPHQYQAKLRRLVLSAGFTGMLETSASVSYNAPVLRRVLALRHAVSRAVARWCLSHSGAQHHDLARVLAAVGVVADGEQIGGRGSTRQTRHYRQQLRDDAEQLAELGIEIDGETLHYRRQPGVFIERADKNPGAGEP